jgi:hypothetical protein
MRFIHHPGAWRNRSMLVRLTAEHLTDPRTKEHQFRLADVYERLARYAEERVAAERVA